MAKSFSVLCIFLAFLYTQIGECIGWCDHPRTGRSDSAFRRCERVFGLVKQPRVGRSDQLSNELAHKRKSDPSGDSWMDISPESTRSIAIPFARGAVPKDGDGNLGGVGHQLQLPKRDSLSPWAFFLITPNFQNHERGSDGMVEDETRDASGE